MTPSLACPDPRDLERMALGKLPEAQAEQLAQNPPGNRDATR
jgi:hypothetical protein